MEEKVKIDYVPEEDALYIRWIEGEKVQAVKFKPAYRALRYQRGVNSILARNPQLIHALVSSEMKEKQMTDAEYAQYLQEIKSEELRLFLENERKSEVPSAWRDFSYLFPEEQL